MRHKTRMTIGISGLALMTMALVASWSHLHMNKIQSDRQPPRLIPYLYSDGDLGTPVRMELDQIDWDYLMQKHDILQIYRAPDGSFGYEWNHPR